MKRLRHNTRGVTLLELLVVIAIIGILSLLTLPNIPAIIAGHRFRTANNDLMAKLRSVRALAIAKGRTLELRMNLATQSFQVWQLGYKEYNLLDEVSNSDIDNEDLTSVLTNPNYNPAAETEEAFILFEENSEKLHIAPIWDPQTGEKIYDVPINYDITKPMGDHRNGLDPDNGIQMTVGGNAVAANGTGKIVFYPSGTVENNVVITLNAPSQYPGTYEIRVFKAGQVRGAT